MVDYNMDGTAGVFVLQTLLSEFTTQVNHKLELLVNKSISEKQLMKTLQRGEDIKFDQLLCALGCVAEHCLPSLIDALFSWMEKQIPNVEVKFSDSKPRSSLKSKSELSIKEQEAKKLKYELAVKIVFVLALIEVLQQLPVHPLPESHVQKILNQAFLYFKHAALTCNGDSVDDRAKIIADLFAEVVGVMAKTKFQSVRRKFLFELDEAKRLEHSTRIILGLTMGMRFYRVKMYPVEDFESSFRFLRELADYCIEVKEREIKHGLAGLFVEILIPVAAAVKTEVNVPVLRDFVDALYPTALELSKRKKNLLAIYPLVTCLLCVSQKQFFLNNWHIFLENCLSNLKHRDQKISRVALESLYRLLWAYTVRVKCESNKATQARLQSVIKTLFPFGSRAVIPKDTPQSIYVKIIQFIAQERLDFAMKEIVMDLLGISGTQRSPRFLTLQPERMNIVVGATSREKLSGLHPGLRAFLVITDSLQKKDGAPPMPSTVGVMPSGNTLRVKKTFSNKVLTEDDAKTIGVFHYHKHVQKALDSILLSLDSQVGLRMMMTQRTSDVISEENKPKIELFRTCVAAMPRLIPAGMSHMSLFELLSRLTIHIDEELRSLAFSSLQLFALDFPDKREDVVATFIAFIVKQISDVHPVLLDTALKHLVQLISGWRNKIIGETPTATSMMTPPAERRNTYASFINRVEGFSLVLLCSHRSVTRKLACILCNEVKLLAQCLHYKKFDGALCKDVLDRLCWRVVDEVLMDQEVGLHLSDDEIYSIKSAAEKSDITALVECSASWHQNKEHLWTSFLSTFMKPSGVPSFCSSAVDFAWSDVNIRLDQLWNHLDPLQSSGKKSATLGSNDLVLSVWTNYLAFTCSCSPSNLSVLRKRASSAIPAGTPDWMVSLLRDPVRLSATPSHIFQKLVPILRSDVNAAVKESVVVGLGSTSEVALCDLMVELEPLIKDASKLQRQENLRRKRRRDQIRQIVAYLLERLARNKVLSKCLDNPLNPNQVGEDKRVHQNILLYITETSLFLESIDKMEPLVMSAMQQSVSSTGVIPGSFIPSASSPVQNSIASSSAVDDLRMHFTSMITLTFKHLPDKHRSQFLSCETRRSLFFLFGRWCERYCNVVGALDRLEALDGKTTDFGTLLHISVLKAECAVLCCGPMFDNIGLQEENGYIYPWLEALLDCSNPRVHDIGRDAVVLLLRHNRNCCCLLQWVIDKCYTGSLLVSSGCFVSVFSAYPYISAPTTFVSLMHLGVFHMATSQVSQAAHHLLTLLQSRCSSHDELVLPSTHNLWSDNVFSIQWCYDAQLELSCEMAKNYPDLTIPMLSEFFSRFVCSTNASQRCMLQYIVPWFSNVSFAACNTRGKKTECSMFSQSSMFIICNLTYITAKYHSGFMDEVEKCWSALCHSSPENIHFLLDFTTILLSNHFSKLITETSKLMIVFLSKANQQKVVEYLSKECQVLEYSSFRFSVAEESPPFRIEKVEFSKSLFANNSPKFRGSKKSSKRLSMNGSKRSHVLSMKKMHHHKSLQHINFSNQPGDVEIFAKQNISLPEIIHGDVAVSQQSAISASIFSLPTCSESIPTYFDVSQTKSSCSRESFHEREKPERDTAKSSLLDFPHHYGLFYLPLQDLLLKEKDTSHRRILRSNVGCVLLYEIFIHHCFIPNWDVYMPTIALAIVFGMDHSCFGEVPEKCQLLLAHILMKHLSTSDQEEVMNQVLYYKKMTSIPVFCESVEHMSTKEEARNEQLSSVKEFLFELLTKSKTPRWYPEDISPSVILHGSVLSSAEPLTLFLHKIVEGFGLLISEYPLVEKFSKQALWFAVNGRMKHYRRRALQVFRALDAPLCIKDLCALSHCLSECASDSCDPDTQSFMIEILLTLLKSCDNGLKETVGKSCRLIQPKTSSSVGSVKITMDVVGNMSHLTPTARKGHMHKRSGSVTINKKQLDAVTNKQQSSPKLERGANVSSKTLTIAKEAVTRPLTSFQLTESNSAIIQIFWISVGLLESEYDFEYLLALRILCKILDQVSICEINKVTNLERYLQNLKWSSFQGLQSLLLKGLTGAATFEPSFHALCNLSTASHLPIVSNIGGYGIGFAVNIIVLLPFLAAQFQSPDKLCCECAQNIAQVCVDDFKKEVKLQSLAHVMSLYVNNTYNKGDHTWVSVVCKYVHETFPDALQHQLLFLNDMLDKGHSFHLQCLQIVLSLLSYSNAVSCYPQPFYVQDLLKVVSKHLYGKHWKEALSILKLAVLRSSKLAAPSHVVLSDGSKADGKEYVGLPGLTMSFNLDVLTLPVTDQTSPAMNRESFADTGDNHTVLKQIESDSPSSKQNPMSIVPNRLQALSNICLYMQQTCLLEPQISPPLQARNELMIENPADGFKEEDVVYLEKEPSSYQSDQMVDDINCQGVLRDFDFLNELEETEGDGADNFNTAIHWGSSPNGTVTTKEANAVEEQPEEYDLTTIIPQLSADEDDTGVSSDHDKEVRSDHDGDDIHVRSDHDGDDIHVLGDHTDHGDMDDACDDEHYAKLSSSLSLDSSNSATLASIGSSEKGNDDDEDVYPTNGSNIKGTAGKEECENFYVPGDLVQPSTSYYIHSTSPIPPDTLESNKNNCTEKEQRSDASPLTFDPQKRWHDVIESLDKDEDGNKFAFLFLMFPSFFRRICWQFTSVSKEGCQVLGTQLYGVSSHFSLMLDDLPSQLQCPLCLTTPSSLKTKLEEIKVESHNLQNHYQQYLQTYQNVSSMLLTVKDHIQQTCNKDDVELGSGDLEQKQLRLLQQLYKLHHNLLIIYQTFSRLVTKASNPILQNKEVFAFINNIHQQLIIYEAKFNLTDQELDLDMQLSMNPPDAVSYFLRLLKIMEFQKSIEQLCLFRKMHQHPWLGLTDDYYSDFLANVFFLSLGKQETNEDVQLLLRYNDAETMSEKLLEVNSQIQSSLHLLELKPRTKTV